MKRTRAQNPKLQDPQDPTAANPSPKPQPLPQPHPRRTKQPRQPKAPKKTSATTAREAAAAAAAAAAPAASAGAEIAPTVPDVCPGGGDEAAGQTAEWDLVDGGLSNGSWWTFGVEEEKLLGWFPFVEEDFRCLGGGRGDAAEAVAFDDDIWRIHQIYEIPSYAAK